MRGLLVVSCVEAQPGMTLVKAGWFADVLYLHRPELRHPQLSLLSRNKFEAMLLTLRPRQLKSRLS